MGFDGAELQASHSSLLRQFLSPRANLRSDAYGGSVEKRLRLAFEIIEAIRAEVGREFVLGIRLCGDELIDGGVTIRETIAACELLTQTRHVGLLSTPASARLPTRSLWWKARCTCRRAISFLCPARCDR